VTEDTPEPPEELGGSNKPVAVKRELPDEEEEEENLYS